MPQLDKYIYFSNLISLTIFFLLIYIFVRGVIIPNISSILKYRKKQLNLFDKQLESNKFFLISLSNNLDKKIKKYILFLAENLNKKFFFYKLQTNIRLNLIYSNITSSLKINKKLVKLITKNKVELKRYQSII